MEYRSEKNGLYSITGPSREKERERFIICDVVVTTRANTKIHRIYLWHCNLAKIFKNILILDSVVFACRLQENFLAFQY
jgi:hypothetical protein